MQILRLLVTVLIILSAPAHAVFERYFERLEQNTRVMKNLESPLGDIKQAALDTMSIISTGSNWSNANFTGPIKRDAGKIQINGKYINPPAPLRQDQIKFLFETVSLAAGRLANPLSAFAMLQREYNRVSTRIRLYQEKDRKTDADRAQYAEDSEQQKHLELWRTFVWLDYYFRQFPYRGPRGIDVQLDWYMYTDQDAVNQATVTKINHFLENKLSFSAWVMADEAKVEAWRERYFPAKAVLPKDVADNILKQVKQQNLMIFGAATEGFEAVKQDLISRYTIMRNPARLMAEKAVIDPIVTRMTNQNDKAFKGAVNQLEGDPAYFYISRYVRKNKKIFEGVGPDGRPGTRRKVLTYYGQSDDDPNFRVFSRFQITGAGTNQCFFYSQRYHGGRKAAILELADTLRRIFVDQANLVDVDGSGGYILKRDLPIFKAAFFQPVRALEGVRPLEDYGNRGGMGIDLVAYVSDAMLGMPGAMDKFKEPFQTELLRLYNMALPGDFPDDRKIPLRLTKANLAILHAALQQVLANYAPGTHRPAEGAIVGLISGVRGHRILPYDYFTKRHESYVQMPDGRVQRKITQAPVGNALKLRDPVGLRGGKTVFVRFLPGHYEILIPVNEDDAALRRYAATHEYMFFSSHQMCPAFEPLFGETAEGVDYDKFMRSLRQ